MRTHNPTNERVKRQYFDFLKEAKRHSEATVDAVAKALSRYEAYSRGRDFKAFHYQQAVAFKAFLAGQESRATGERLSKSTLNSTLANLKRFFQWLSGQPGYRSRLNYADAEYFNLSEKDTRVATARREREAPTLEQIKHTIGKMPAETDIEKRNRAVLAFTILTGARDRAIASLKLKHVDLVAGCVHQDARDVATKASKSIVTFFFPVGDDVREIVAAWVVYLRDTRLWGPGDPIFPASEITLDSARRFHASGLKRAHWSSASPIRAIFREAFTRAALPYFNPHSFRKTLALLGEVMCGTPEEFKAWSQNLGHEDVLTTFRSYGQVSARRQGEIIFGLAAGGMARHDIAQFAKVVARELQSLRRSH